MADTLVCTVELSKTDGVTISVKNEKGKITQTVVMDGTSIKTQVKGDKHTSLITQLQNSVVTKVSKGSSALSTITQKEANVTIDCENYTLNADTVKVNSKKDTTVTSKAKLTASSSKDMTLKSSAKFTASSTSNMTLSSKGKLAATATSGAELKGSTLKVEGKTSALMKAGTAASVKGLKVDVKGTAQASIAAAATTLGKDLTTVKGKLVKVEGMLVKLG